MRAKNGRKKSEYVRPRRPLPAPIGHALESFPVFCDHLIGRIWNRPWNALTDFLPGAAAAARSKRSEMNRQPGQTVFGICGWKNSGKTTLIESLIPHLIAQGLSLAVVKHDAHGLEVDRRGKDSDRFFRAGGDVILKGPGEEICRFKNRKFNLCPQPKRTRYRSSPTPQKLPGY